LATISRDFDNPAFSTSIGADPVSWAALKRKPACAKAQAGFVLAIWLP
jgi:hypothetical protein